jgi:hypothetical protein
MNEREIISMMRENAALCVLEAEVVIAMKLYEAGHGNELALNEQLMKISEALQTIDIVRNRNAQQAN